MRFSEDEQVRAHETYGAHLSHMAETARLIFARQRGNLTARDRALVAEFDHHAAAARAELAELRRLIQEQRQR
jgi:hypothetical protein